MKKKVMHIYAIKTVENQSQYQLANEENKCLEQSSLDL